MGKTKNKGDVWTDLILNSAAARQLVAIADGDYNGGLEEEGIPPLRRGNIRKGEDIRKYL